MCLIFTASSDTKSYQHSSTLFEPLLHWLFPRMSEARIDLLHHLFRKTAHLTNTPCSDCSSGGRSDSRKKTTAVPARGAGTKQACH